MLYAIIGVLVIIADQWVKFWVSGNIALESTGEPLIPGILSLVNLHNDGAAFSFLSGSGARIPFIILTGVFVLAVIIALATNFISGRVARWSIVLVAAGGLSNCIDRVIYGYVQDMFKLEFINFPVFNLADVFITVFCIIFVLAILFERDRDDEDDYDDLYDDEDDLPRRPSAGQKRAARAAARAEAAEAKASRKARRDAEDDEYEEYKAARAARQRQQAQAQARARSQEQPARPAAQEEDPFAEWERATARVQQQAAPRQAAQPAQRPVAQRPAQQPAQRPAQQPAQRPAAQPAQRPAAQPAQRPVAKSEPAPAPAPAPKAEVSEEFSLEDILAEFK